jgi:hypothetical protein
VVEEEQGEFCEGQAGDVEDCGGDERLHVE